MTENYRGCYEYLSAQYPEVGGYEFYKELFRTMRTPENGTRIFPSERCVSVSGRTERG